MKQIQNCKKSFKQKYSYSIQCQCINEDKLDVTISISGISQVSSCEREALPPFLHEEKQKGKLNKLKKKLVPFDQLYY